MVLEILDTIKDDYFPTEKIEEKGEFLARESAIHLFAKRFDDHFDPYKGKMHLDNCFHFTCVKIVPKIKDKIIANLAGSLKASINP